MNKIERLNEWKARIEAFKESGQSVAVWCAENGVNKDRLWAWLRKLQTQDSHSVDTVMPSHLLAVELTESEPEPKTKRKPECSPLLLIKIGKATVEVSRGFDQALLSDVLRTLDALC